MTDEQGEPQSTVIVAHVVAAGPSCVDYGIVQNANDTFTLSWGDCVANVWEEQYDDLAVAYLRLGVLLHSARNEQLFAREAPQFSEVAQQFLEQEVEPDLT